MYVCLGFLLDNGYGSLIQLLDMRPVRRLVITREVLVLGCVELLRRGDVLVNYVVQRLMPVDVIRRITALEPHSLKGERGKAEKKGERKINQQKTDVNMVEVTLGNKSLSYCVEKTPDGIP
ncbi:hypothetical protein ANO14919_062500 [Xylariales sp. No.14919]|nr:hypothetical protein ANO14919_062500 [Xylariales sp. No.14919]